MIFVFHFNRIRVYAIRHLQAKLKHKLSRNTPIISLDQRPPIMTNNPFGKHCIEMPYPSTILIKREKNDNEQPFLKITEYSHLIQPQINMIRIGWCFYKLCLCDGISVISRL